MLKEYFSIPNLMGYFRILMIPVFLYTYYHAESREDYLAAFLILGVSLLTDFFDGKIARRFNMVTEFGKILDPVADKLTQGSLAIAVLLRCPMMKLFLAVFLVKECYMSLMGLYIIKKKNIRKGAQWFGKITTAVVDAGIMVLLLAPNLPANVADTLIIVMIAFLLFSLINYIRFYHGILKSEGTAEEL